jgi:hypothetical protein
MVRPEREVFRLLKEQKNSAKKPGKNLKCNGRKYRKHWPLWKSWKSVIACEESQKGSKTVNPFIR